MSRADLEGIAQADDLLTGNFPQRLAQSVATQFGFCWMVEQRAGVGTVVGALVFDEASLTARRTGVEGDKGADLSFIEYKDMRPGIKVPDRQICIFSLFRVGELEASSSMVTWHQVQHLAQDVTVCPVYFAEARARHFPFAAISRSDGLSLEIGTDKRVNMFIGQVDAWLSFAVAVNGFYMDLARVQVFAQIMADFRLPRSRRSRQGDTYMHRFASII